jgi:hypothetical protein
MKTIKFKKSVLIDGAHCERGTVLTVNDSTAALIVADGSAVYHVEEVVSVVEEVAPVAPAPKKAKK